MNNLRGLAVLTVALIPLSAIPASAQKPIQFASFKGGLFAFLNNVSSATFNSVLDGNDPGAPETSFTDDEHHVTYKNITIALSSNANGPATLSSGFLTQKLDLVNPFHLTFTDNVTHKLLLEVTGKAQIQGEQGDTQATFNGTNKGPSVLLTDVQYASSVLSVNNLTKQNSYSTNLNLVLSAPLNPGAGGYLDSFTAQAGGQFTTAVPEASTVMAFGMLLGGGFLRVRKARRVKVA